MKYFFSSLIIILLLHIYLCEEPNTTEDPSNQKVDKEEKVGKTDSTPEDSPKKIEGKREEYERKTKEIIRLVLKEFGLENSKTIKRDELKDLFRKVVQKSMESDSKDGKDNGNSSGMTLGFVDLLFDILVSKETQEFEIDNIMKFFEPEFLADSLKKLFQSLNMENMADILSGPLLSAFGGGSKDTNNDDNTKSNSNQEKSAEL